VAEELQQELQRALHFEPADRRAGVDVAGGLDGRSSWA